MSGFSTPPSAIVLGQSAVASSHTGDTVETALATINIPATAIGKNGRIEVRADFTYTNSANAKTMNVKLGATTLMSQGATTSSGLKTETSIANRGSATSQRAVSFVANSANGIGYLSATGAVDTTANVTLTITGTLGLGTETITLESFQVLLFPKG